MRVWKAVATLLIAVSAAGCGEGPKGSVQVFVEPEDSIPEGVQPGTAPENIRDGWRVEYSKFVAVIGNFRAAQSAVPSSEIRDSQTWVVDLLNTPAGGFVIASFPSVEATRWDKVGFDLAKATAGAGKATGLADADFNAMVQGGLSLWVEGKISKTDGQSCRPSAQTDCVPRNEVTFSWPLNAATSFDDCASATGEAGFSVPTAGTVQVKPTIHGDHWFFTNLTQGAELTERKAQWLADSDLNRDGKVTVDELRQVPIEDLLTQSKGYNNLSGALIPLSTVYDYVEAQARSLGDYQGEGECATRKVLQ